MLVVSCVVFDGLTCGIYTSHFLLRREMQLCWRAIHSAIYFDGTQVEAESGHVALDLQSSDWSSESAMLDGLGTTICVSRADPQSEEWRALLEENPLVSDFGDIDEGTKRSVHEPVIVCARRLFFSVVNVVVLLGLSTPPPPRDADDSSRAHRWLKHDRRLKPGKRHELGKLLVWLAGRVPDGGKICVSVCGGPATLRGVKDAISSAEAHLIRGGHSASSGGLCGAALSIDLEFAADHQ